MDTAQKIYEELSAERSPYVTRAINAAKYTIPMLFTDENTTATTDFNTPYQSLGARGVNNLSSKLILALMPPNTHFFRLNVTGTKASANEEAQSVQETELNQALITAEQFIHRYIENNQIRVTVGEAIKQLLVAGNALLSFPFGRRGVRMYRLANYVIERDALGNIIQIITKEQVHKDTVSDIVTVTGDNKSTDKVDLYTHVFLTENFMYSYYQEVKEEVIPGSEATFSAQELPFIPLRLFKQDGESYGRSFVDEYIGDLVSLERLSKASVELAAICANIKFLVNPNGLTRASKVASASPGDYVPGRLEDIQAIQTNKSMDFAQVNQVSMEIGQRLSYAFLLHSTAQRHAERVTAEEIRTVVGELEDTLGGIYSILSQELQVPLIRCVMSQMASEGELPKIGEGFLTATITTGVEALGRGHDFNKMMTFLQAIGSIPQVLEQLNVRNFALQVATSLSIDTTELLKTEEEMMAEQQQQMAQEMMPQMVEQGMQSEGEMM